MTDTNTAGREAATDGKWYMVNKDGMATLCLDEEDAIACAAEAFVVWPHMGPYRAVQLVEVGRASLAASAVGEPVASDGWPAWCPEAVSALVMLDRMDVGPDDDARVDAVSAIVRSMADKLRPSPPEGMAGWEPIATAPKDGTYLLLWEQYSTHPFVGYWGFGSWSASHEHVDAEGGWDGANVVDSISQDLITHWMPLPAPPLPASEAKEL